MLSSLLYQILYKITSNLTKDVQFTRTNNRQLYEKMQLMIMEMLHKYDFNSKIQARDICKNCIILQYSSLLEVKPLNSKSKRKCKEHSKSCHHESDDSQEIMVESKITPHKFSNSLVAFDGILHITKLRTD
jgi:hypothetical protein